MTGYGGVVSFEIDGDLWRWAGAGLQGGRVAAPRAPACRQAWVARKSAERAGSDAVVCDAAHPAATRRTAKFIDSVKLPYIAPSLGGVESLIEQPTVIR